MGQSGLSPSLTLACSSRCADLVTRASAHSVPPAKKMAGMVAEQEPASGRETPEEPATPSASRAPLVPGVGPVHEGTCARRRGVASSRPGGRPGSGQTAEGGDPPPARARLDSYRSVIGTLRCVPSPRSIWSRYIPGSRPFLEPGTSWVTPGQNAPCAFPARARSVR
jgi:hypothetical protein